MRTNHKAQNQTSFDFDPDGVFHLPPSYLLKPPGKSNLAPPQGLLEENAEQLETVLSDFRVQGDISDIHYGPVVTRYDLQPAPGIKSQRVIALADDIARSMSALAVRVAVVPGQNVIGIELPNDSPQIVYLKSILNSKKYAESKSKLTIGVGKTTMGNEFCFDLQKMPHLLVAGATGAGKSVCINTIIVSILYKAKPDEVSIAPVIQVGVSTFLFVGPNIVLINC